MKKVLAGLAIGLLLIGIPGICMATAINVDFGFKNQTVYIGTAAAPDAGTEWNGLDFNGATNLEDSYGTVTSVGISTTASQAYRDPDGNDLLRDRVFVTGTWTAFDVTISGLDDSLLYDLYLYGSNTRYSSTYGDGTQSDYALGDKEPDPDWEHNTHYALLTQIGATDGEIVITVDRYASSAAAVIGGLQLVSAPVPEPSTMLLLGAGLLCLVGLRRKFKA